jgi:peroxiredoxin Q/BCP
MRLARLAMLFAVSTVALPAVSLTAGCGAPVARPDGGTGLLPEGSVVPAVSGVDHTGRTRSLADELGHAVLVYFYPKDGTPGCTTEACTIRDRWAKFESAGVRVLGVSAQDRETHVRFVAEEKLPFALIADTELAWAKAFGVGSFAGLTDRVSFLVGPDGRVAKVYSKVVPADHADQVLADAAALR